MNLNKYIEDDFYVYKYSLKIKKNQTPETMATFFKVWSVFMIGLVVYIYTGLSNGYGEPISWTILGWSVLAIPVSLIFTIKKVYQKHQVFQSILFSQSFFLFGMSWMILFKNVLISGVKNIPLEETGFKPYFIFYNVFMYACVILIFLGSYLYFKSCLENGTFRKESVEANIKKSQIKYVAPSLIITISGVLIFSLSKIDFIGSNHILISIISILVSLLFIFASPGPMIVAYCKKRFPDFIIDYSKEETEIEKKREK